MYVVWCVLYVRCKLQILSCMIMFHVLYDVCCVLSSLMHCCICNLTNLRFCSWMFSVHNIMYMMKWFFIFIVFFFVFCVCQLIFDECTSFDVSSHWFHASRYCNVKCLVSVNSGTCSKTLRSQKMRTKTTPRHSLKSVVTSMLESAISGDKKKIETTNYLDDYPTDRKRTGS